MTPAARHFLPLASRFPVREDRRELAIVAKALADGRDMTKIGLMCDIAQRTIAVLGNGASV
jgi:hypothetical protein